MWLPKHQKNLKPLVKVSKPTAHPSSQPWDQHQGDCLGGVWRQHEGRRQEDPRRGQDDWAGVGNAPCTATWPMNGLWLLPVVIARSYLSGVIRHTPESSCWPMVIKWMSQRLRTWTTMEIFQETVEMKVRTIHMMRSKRSPLMKKRVKRVSCWMLQRSPEAEHGRSYVGERTKTEMVVESSAMLSTEVGTPDFDTPWKDKTVFGWKCCRTIPIDYSSWEPSCMCYWPFQGVPCTTQARTRARDVTHVWWRCEGSVWTWEWGPAAFGGIVQLLWSFQCNHGKTWEGCLQERVGVGEWTGQSTDSSCFKHPIGLNAHGCSDWHTSSLEEDGWRFDSGIPRLEQEPKGIVPDRFQETSWFVSWTVFQWRSIWSHAWSYGWSRLVWCGTGLVVLCPNETSGRCAWVSKLPMQSPDCHPGPLGQFGPQGTSLSFLQRGARQCNLIQHQLFLFHNSQFLLFFMGQVIRFFFNNCICDKACTCVATQVPFFWFPTQGPRKIPMFGLFKASWSDPQAIPRSDLLLQRIHPVASRYTVKSPRVSIVLEFVKIGEMPSVWRHQAKATRPSCWSQNRVWVQCLCRDRCCRMQGLCR